MPYTTINELPEGVRNALPPHAQDIYKEAFNSVYDTYDEPNERRENDTREETAHKVAWSAVKKAGYEKGDDTKWRKS